MKCLTQANFRFENGTWTKVEKPSPQLPRIEGSARGTSSPSTSSIELLTEKMETQFETLTELLLKLHEEQSKKLDSLEKELKELKARIDDGNQ